ncbi:hypothetical protein FHS18_002015 [Paenibacillus phyllosphaerae]|uniref:Uncharacterized protein n=1 Tax=Paenibacillus phyllosphaerae TaxID=274593 RepID=A0A7W5AWN4_9BACL|nr:hypothetical protein [Paenibacillus phyllosphaerae]
MGPSISWLQTDSNQGGTANHSSLSMTGAFLVFNLSNILEA